MVTGLYLTEVLKRLQDCRSMDNNRTDPRCSIFVKLRLPLDKPGSSLVLYIPVRVTINRINIQWNNSARGENKGHGQ